MKEYAKKPELPSSFCKALFAKRLRWARAGSGLTSAEIPDLNERALLIMEDRREGSSGKGTSLFALSQAYGVSADYLLGLTNSKIPQLAKVEWGRKFNGRLAAQRAFECRTAMKLTKLGMCNIAGCYVDRVRATEDAQQPRQGYCNRHLFNISRALGVPVDYLLGIHDTNLPSANNRPQVSPRFLVVNGRG